MSTTILLGPQRFTTTVGSTVRALALTGPLAMVNAGWEERESDDAELAGHLDGRGVNLRLHHRMMDVLAKDEHFAAAALAFRDRMDELRAFYGIRLQAAIDAVHAVAHRTSMHSGGPSPRRPRWRPCATSTGWYASSSPSSLARPVLSRRRTRTAPSGWHQGEIGAILDECEAVVVAGGNVRTLLWTLRFFDVTIRPRADGRRLVGRGDGADWTRSSSSTTSPRRESRRPRCHDTGLGRLPGIIALPHAKRRLQLDDHERMSVLAEALR